MTRIFSCFYQLKLRLSADPGRFWHQCLFLSFWLSLAFFPLGYGFREVMPPLCLVFLVLYYRFSWHSSVLYRLGPIKYLFLLLFIMILIGIIFSIDPLSSLLHAGMGLNKAYILPFIAMECARDLRHLSLLTWAMTFACFWEGLDGLWQAFTGSDFIMGYTFKGRLTGSLGDYTVGNYLALTLVPAAGSFYILRQHLSLPLCLFLTIAIFWPAAFLFIGASSRSGLLALAASLAAWVILARETDMIKKFLLPACAIFLFLLFESHRFSADAIFNDNRWDLWHLAWQVFLAHPWFGAGAGQYNHAFQLIGLAPEREVITISHPHNLYLDLLYAHGVIGFVLGCIFLFGFLFWGLKHLRPNLAQINPREDRSLYWILATWFGLGYFAWLINGIFGHDFYRIWWLALAMCNLGIMIGAIVNGAKPEPSIRDTTMKE